jgi:hypothetical protein
MSNHYSQTKTDGLPEMKTSPYTSRNNTNVNRDDYLDQMRKTHEYKRVFIPETGELTIWYVRQDDVGIKVTTSNTEHYCTITIEHFCLGEKLTRKCHEFHPLGFSASVNTYLLTPEDLEQQRAFRQQEQERKDALERAHNSRPKTCGGVRECEHCKDEKRHHEMFYCSGYT